MSDRHSLGVDNAMTIKFGDWFVATGDHAIGVFFIVAIVFTVLLIVAIQNWRK